MTSVSSTTSLLKRAGYRSRAVLQRLLGSLRGTEGTGIEKSIRATRSKRRWREWTLGFVESLITYPAKRRLPAVQEKASTGQTSEVDRHWSGHTVRGNFFLSRQASLDYIRELTDGRPYKRELLRLHGPHTDKVILDYGCGPGNDLAGFAEFSGASKIIGMDISARALRIARSRVSWHARHPERLEFIHIRDGDETLPLADESVDYVQSLGVIHHTSRPERVLAELARVLKPDGEMRIMLYNADSVHIQLTVGYVWRYINRSIGDMQAEQAFEKTADLGAPIAHCVRPEKVSSWLAGIPVHAEFLGGFFVPGEKESFQQYNKMALEDSRLPEAQRRFLQELVTDSAGFPIYRGLSAGLGGVYRLTKLHEKGKLHAES